MSLDRRQALSLLEEARDVMAKVVESDESEERGYWLEDPIPKMERREHVRMVMRRLRATLTMLEADDENQPVRKTKKRK